ncbi:MAG: hypothetical protein ACKOZV_07745 [Bacteroidota bacterium]|jgi:hypothetical protein
MKKSKVVSLVLITAALAACTKEEPKTGEKKVYMRTDTTARYSRTHVFPMYYAFRAYGNYVNGSYNRRGYFSGGINRQSNIGTNPVKSNIIRGGFGSRSSGIIS